MAVQPTSRVGPPTPLTFFDEVEHSQTHLDVAEAWALNNHGLLARVVNHWLDEGEWLTVDEVALAVLRETDENAYEALRSLPPPLGRIEPPERRVELRVRAFASIDHAQPLLDAFIRALMLAASLLKQGEKSPLVLSDDDLTGTLSMPVGAVAKVAQLLFAEGWMWHGRSGDAEGSWQCNLGEAFLPVRKVTTLDQYLEIEGRRFWSQPANRSTLPAAVLLEDELAETETGEFDPVAASKPALLMSALHPAVAAEVARPLATGHSDEAVRVAAFALNELLGERSGLTGLEGQDLAGAALGGNAPKLWLAPAESRDRRAEQDGWRMLAQGCFAALRNPVAHRRVYRDQTSAFEALATISMVMRRIEEMAP